MEEQRLQGIEFYSFGYRTSLKPLQYDFKTAAELLFSEIQITLKERDIIFVAHSMGRLAVQQYIVNRYDFFDELNLKALNGEAYLSVPFHGSGLAEFFPTWLINRQLNSLRRRNSQLQQLEENWNKYVYRGGTEEISTLFKMVRAKPIQRRCNMTKLPRTVLHRFTSESITFLQTEEEKNRKYLLIEVALPPQGKGPPLHYHDAFVEEFAVLQGSLTVTLNKEDRLLEAGETLTAEVGTAHTFNNNQDEPVVFQVKLTPPKQFEQSVRIHYGLMEDGLTDENGIPKSLYDLALILTLQNTLVADKPLWLQRGLFGILTFIGRATKKYKRLEKYISKEI